MENEKEQQLPINKQPGQEDRELNENPDRSDIVGGARQQDQLEKLHPDTVDPEIEGDRKSHQHLVGSPPITDVDNGERQGAD